MARILRRLLSDRSGATAIEYGLIAALIGLVLVGSLQLFGDNISNKLFNNVITGLK